MHLTRRNLLGGLAGGAIAAPMLPRLAEAAQPALLVARPSTAKIAPEGYPATSVWSYNDSVPGPILRVRQGDRVQQRFTNELDQPATVHWHGIRIDNAMDGVPGLTQEAVSPGADFLYDFAVPDAGTYWFHPHNRSWEQMARGLYGALVVEETAGAPDVDADEVLLLDDWRLTDDAQIAGGFGDIHDWAHAGRIGNWITVNGNGAWSHEVERFSRLRLRLVNTANARIFSLEVRGLEGWIVALDGMPLETPVPLKALVLAPAQRADLVVDVVEEDGGEAFLVSFEADGGYALATFPVRGLARSATRPDPEPLPPNPVPELGPIDGARRVELLMEGGAMGAMRGAILGGRMTDLRDMVAAGKVWAFNGMADMSDTPLIEAALGETIRIAMKNDTAWPHAMHLHGHHFRQILPDGALAPLRDTLLIDRGETAEIAFVADNSGKWLLHCHMLEHSAGGMMTWLSVA